MHVDAEWLQSAAVWHADQVELLTFQLPSEPLASVELLVTGRAEHVGHSVVPDELAHDVEEELRE